MPAQNSSCSSTVCPQKTGNPVIPSLLGILAAIDGKKSPVSNRVLLGRQFYHPLYLRQMVAISGSNSGKILFYLPKGADYGIPAAMANERTVALGLVPSEEIATSASTGKILFVVGEVIGVADLQAPDDELRPLLFALAGKFIYVHDFKGFYSPLVRRLGARILPARHLDTWILGRMVHFTTSLVELKRESPTMSDLINLLPSGQRYLGEVPATTPDPLQAYVDQLLLLPRVTRHLLIQTAQLWSTDRPLQIEMDFLPELTRIETEGLPVNRARLEQEAKALEPILTQLSKEFAAIKFNPDSQQDLEDYLKQKGFEVPNLRGDSLVAHIHDPLIAKVLNYRVTKGKHDFLKECLSQGEGRVRARFNQISSRSGRMSAAGPNVQAIRRDLQEFFYLADPGRVILAMDFPGSHLRVLAQISKDENLVRVFMEKQDPHRITAARLTGKTPTEVSDTERDLGKTLNYGTTNCMGPDTLRDFAKATKDINMSLEEAKKFLEVSSEAYPGVTAMKAVLSDKLAASEEEIGQGRAVEKAITVKTLSGRVAKAIGLPQAVCYPLMGTEAEILKIAATDFGKECRDRGLDAQIINVVHDSIVVDALVQDQTEVSAILREVTEAAWWQLVREFPTPIVVKVLSTSGEAGSLPSENPQ